MSCTPKARGGYAVTTHLDLPDVDATRNRALEAGATVALPLGDMFWGAGTAQAGAP
ncbi:VOC family protein [Sorangium sp. So ce388]|uniref:VOC family protein n=1 Tax=Sorangium sp. So ce388 TaxID=3133309 RepID=UPI003F5B6443